MSARLLVDAGNTRTKVALADPLRVVLRESAFEPKLWADRLGAVAAPPWDWVVAGVDPARVAEVAAWAGLRGETCRLVRDWRDVPVEVAGCDPAQIGVDRLLDALAASRRKRPGVPAVTVDAGTAIVVNLVSPGGAFLGGGIAPGLRSMFGALHAATARLPRVEVDDFDRPVWPGTTTVEAITAGCFHAALGGVERLVRHAAAHLTPSAGDPVDVFVTGGDGARLARHAEWPAGCRATFVETLTLEGLRLAAGDS